MTETHPRFRVKEYLVEGNKIVFIFTALGTKMAVYHPFARALNKHGYSCIIYDYPVSIVTEAYLPEWHRFYDDALKDVKTRIKKLQHIGYTNFYVHGTSMGTLIASLVGRTCPEVTHSVLNLTYGDLAFNIFTSRPPRRAKQKFVDRGVTQESLASELAYVDPIKTAHEFKNKKVLLYLSRLDRVLDYDDTRRTREELKKAGANLTYYENKYLGHYLGGAKNLFGIKRLILFFES